MPPRRQRSQPAPVSISSAPSVAMARPMAPQAGMRSRLSTTFKTNSAPSTAIRVLAAPRGQRLAPSKIDRPEKRGHAEDACEGRGFNVGRAHDEG